MQTRGSTLRRFKLAPAIGRSLVFLFLAVSGGTSLAAPQKTPRLVRIGAYDNAPKISIVSEDSVVGFWPDLIAEIAHLESWEIKYVSGSWQDGVDKLLAGDIDIMPDVALTPERARKFTFSDQTVLMSWTRLYVNSESDWFHSITDLDGKTVAALAGSVNLDGPNGLRELADNFNLSVVYLELPDYDAVFRAIESGAADAGITNRNFGNKNAGKYRVQATSFMFQPVSLKFAFPNPAPRTAYLKARIDADIAALTRDNTSVYYRLLSKYFENEVAEKTVEVWPKWLLRLLPAVALILFMFGIIAFVSRRQVARKTRELRERNAELAQSEHRYHDIFDAPTDAIFIHDMQTGQVLDVNQATLQMYGLTREQASNIDPSELSSGRPPYDWEHAAANIETAAREGAHVFDWQARRLNGEEFWVEVSLRRTSISGQDRIIAVVRDISERKQAAADLAAERERLLVTLRSIGDAVITTDTDGTVQLLNKVAEELTGWTAAEAIGRPFQDVLRIVNGETGQPNPDPVQAVLRSGAITDLPDNSVLIARDGRRRRIADSIAPIHDANSENIGAVLVFRDVSDQLRLEQEVLKIKKLESVGVLAGGIAHDFNNILAAMMGNLELAKWRITDDSETRELLQEAENAVTRAGGLTKQLLTFARGGEPVKEAASLPQIIRESAEFVLHGSSVAANVQSADDLWLIDSDPGQISQVVQNLVLNARHAMPEGGNVDISCANCPAAEVDPLLPLAKGDYVTLTITDHGVGIPATIVDQIFDPFFSTKQEGSGLGLAITYSIISKHGGHIGVESKPGQGTRFTIHLPAADKNARRAAPATDPLAELMTGRVLLMDDEPSVRHTMGRMLSHLGLTVEIVADGQEACARFAEARAADEGFDLVIMDLTVPGGMGGQEAARVILAEAPAARLLVASGYSNDPVLANFRDYGFRGIIVKPVSLAELSRAVASALG